jgi:hypothetical protein
VSLRQVRIRNPIDGPGWTSAKQAIKYIKRGQARFVTNTEIEFIESDYRSVSAGRTMKSTTEPEALVSPTNGPALMVVDSPLAVPGSQSLRTFAPYPIAWEGYRKAA